MRLNNRLKILGICFGVAMLAQAACGGQPELAESQDADITVREIVNRVEVNGLNPETNERKFVELQLGQSLSTGNLVKTHEYSSTRVDISIQNFSRVSRTAPKTIWKLGRFALDGEAVIELQEGKIFVFDEDDGQEHWPLHIETPAGIASARGTWMAVEFDPVSGTVRAECLREICELENDFGYQVFTNEQTVDATADTVPTEPVPMERPDVEAFHDLPEVLSAELIIPAPFTEAEARTELETARIEAIERKQLASETTNTKTDTTLTRLGEAGEDTAEPIYERVEADAREELTDLGNGDTEQLTRSETDETKSSTGGKADGTEGPARAKADSMDEPPRTYLDSAEESAKVEEDATPELTKAEINESEGLVSIEASTTEDLIRVEADRTEEPVGREPETTENIADSLAVATADPTEDEADATEDIATEQANLLDATPKAEADETEGFSPVEADAVAEPARPEPDAAEELVSAEPDAPEELVSAEPGAAEELASADAAPTEELARSRGDAA